MIYIYIYIFKCMLESDSDCVLYQQTQPCVRRRALRTPVACAVQRALVLTSCSLQLTTDPMARARYNQDLARMHD